MHSSIVLTLTSVIKLLGILVRSKSQVSWRPSRKDLCQRWIVRFAKHFSLYTSHSKAHISPISFPKSTQKSITTICWNECSFFSLFHTPINTCVDLPRLPSLLYSPYTVPYCLGKIYSSPTRLCASECYTSFPSFSTVHSPQRLFARKGLSTCCNKTRRTLSAVSHSKLIPCSLDAY